MSQAGMNPPPGSVAGNRFDGDGSRNPTHRAVVDKLVGSVRRANRAFLWTIFLGHR